MVIILDCNIWITIAINRQIDFLAILQKKKIYIAACRELYNEVTNVLLRPKLKKYFSKLDIEQLIQVYELTTIEYEITEIEPVVSDKKDNYLFALSKITNADYLITGDKLLLQRKRISANKNHFICRF